MAKYMLEQDANNNGKCLNLWRVITGVFRQAVTHPVYAKGSEWRFTTQRAASIILATF